MFKILKKLKPIEWLMVLFTIGFITIQVWLDLKLPEYMKDITKLINSNGEMKDIWMNGLYMVLCAFGSLAAAFVTGFFAAMLSARISKDLREKVNDKVMSFSMEEINHFSTGSLITRSTNDIRQVQNFIAIGVQIIVKAPITAVWAIVKITSSEWEWTAITGAAIGVMAILFTFMIIFALPRYRKIQKLTDNLNRTARENLTGVRVIRAYNAEEEQMTKFNEATNVVSKTELFINRAGALLQPTMMFVMSSLSLGIYWVGAYIINRNATQATQLNIFSNMIVFTNYAVQIIMAFLMTVIIFVQMPRAQVSAKRIHEVLEKNTKIIDGKIKLNDQIESVKFENVNFKYPDATEYVLKNISFEAYKGEKIALIGATGSGKSTLINLLLRFYDVTDGQIKINENNLNEYTQESLRNKIGYASQKAVIFKGSIKENVDLSGGALTADADEMNNVINVSQAKEFVESKEEKYDFELTQGGTNLSGGQKQRISIARTIYGNSDIYIFDDTFSALDYKTDKNVRNALKEKTKNAITFIIAQRIGTIIDSDKIIVIDEGEIVGFGKHEELLKNCKVYQEIAYSQLSKEELNA